MEAKSESSTNGLFSPTTPNITSIKLNGTNYILWSRSVEIFLTGRWMDHHLTNDKAEKNDPRANFWKQDDAQIMSMMLNNVEPNTSMTLLYLKTAKDMWNRLKHMYSCSENLSRIYEVCKQYFNLEQGNQSIEIYFSTVMGVCEERNMYLPFTDDVSAMEKQRHNMDVVRFLAGLRSEYDPIKAQILGGTELPTITEVFSRLQRASPSTQHVSTHDEVETTSMFVGENRGK